MTKRQENTAPIGERTVGVDNSESLRLSKDKSRGARPTQSIKEGATQRTRGSGANWAALGRSVGGGVRALQTTVGFWISVPSLSPDPISCCFGDVSNRGLRERLVETPSSLESTPQFLLDSA